MNDKNAPMMDLEEALRPLIRKDYTSGDIVRMVRERLGWKPSDLSDVTGINSGNIANYESGEKGIGKTLAHKFAIALRISPTSILYPNGIQCEGDSLNEIKERSDKLIQEKKYA